jgi:hypothetical protein
MSSQAKYFLAKPRGMIPYTQISIPTDWGAQLLAQDAAKLIKERCGLTEPLGIFTPSSVRLPDDHPIYHGTKVIYIRERAQLPPLIGATPQGYAGQGPVAAPVVVGPVATASVVAPPVTAAPPVDLRAVRLLWQRQRNSMDVLADLVVRSGPASAANPHPHPLPARAAGLRRSQAGGTVCDASLALAGVQSQIDLMEGVTQRMTAASGGFASVVRCASASVVRCASAPPPPPPLPLPLPSPSPLPPPPPPPIEYYTIPPDWSPLLDPPPLVGPATTRLLMIFGGVNPKQHTYFAPLYDRPEGPYGKDRR